MTRLVLALLLLAACGPMQLPVAEQQCLEPARLAQRPRGNIAVGADSNGMIGTSFSIGISSDYLTGRDPDEVYASCVRARAGQSPSRPFSSLAAARM
jgi:hypothetical protein